MSLVAGWGETTTHMYSGAQTVGLTLVEILLIYTRGIALPWLQVQSPNLSGLFTAGVCITLYFEIPADNIDNI